MRILLVGEYSRFHNSLKEGLQKLQHEVTLIGRADSFKNYPIDVSLEATFFRKKIPNLFRQFVYRIFKKDIGSWEVAYRFYKYRKAFQGYDVVQLINEFPLATSPFLERKMLNYIFKHNKRVFLSSCGDDHYYLNYILNAALPYHILTPYVKDHNTKQHFTHSLQYLNNRHKALHEFVIEHVQGVIPANFDYDMAYRTHPKALAMVPFPINIEKLAFQQLSHDGVTHIFHGVNKVNRLKKGNDIIAEALAIIEQKYPKRVRVKTAYSLPYDEYIQTYDQAHIIMDQIYGYDQGYNALEAMAKGKVVFSGAETDFLNHYKLSPNTVLINATPNADNMVANLSELIENPEKIVEISQNARAFVEKHHEYTSVAKQYLERWNS